MKTQNASEYEVDQNYDQMKVIFDLIGKQSNEDLSSCIKNSKTVTYCEELQ